MLSIHDNLNHYQQLLRLYHPSSLATKIKRSIYLITISNVSESGTAEAEDILTWELGVGGAFGAVLPSKKPQSAYNYVSLLTRLWLLWYGVQHGLVSCASVICYSDQAALGDGSLTK
jgi:hypothetical protein